MKLISKVKVVYFFLILFFISLFIHQQVYAQLDYENEEHFLQLEYSKDWKLNKDTQSETGSENAKLLNKKEGKVVYPAFNQFDLVQLIPYTENAGSVSILDGTTVFSVTLYANMSSLEDDKVYKNMSSLADTRIYTNLSSFADSKVYTNLSSLEDKVFPNMSSLADTRIYTNLSSFADSKVYTNLSSLDDKVFHNLSSFADSKVYTNLSSLEDKVFPNMSSLESSKVFPNMSSLRQ